MPFRNQKNKLEIDNAAISHNFSIIKGLSFDRRVMLMVKANAYGHGLLNVARLLAAEADAFGVARYEEAITLLSANIGKPVVLMSGLHNIEHAKNIHHDKLQISIATKTQYRDFIETKFNQKLTVWLKFNTGMNRLGLPLALANQYIREMKKNRFIKEIILMTHLSSANESNNQKNDFQCRTLLELGKRHSLQTSIANSAALLQYPHYKGDWVRPGIMLYGASPIEGKSASTFGLQPAMTLSSYLLDIRQQRKGDQIGYQGSWICKEDILLGVVPIGYGDGYPRNIAPGTPVWVNGSLCPIIGRVSMDLITIDLSNCKKPKIADYVELWGKELSIDQIAKFAMTLPNELLTRVSPRILEYSLR